METNAEEGEMPGDSGEGSQQDDKSFQQSLNQQAGAANFHGSLFHPSAPLEHKTSEGLGEDGCEAEFEVEQRKREVRRPMNAFLIFCKRHRTIVRNQYPDKDNRSVTKILGDMWANLTDKEKSEYTSLAKEYKDAFMKANPGYTWHNTQKIAQPAKMATRGPTNVRPPRSLSASDSSEGTFTTSSYAGKKSGRERAPSGGSGLKGMGGLNLLLMVGETVRSQDNPSQPPTHRPPPNADLSVANSLLQLAEIASERSSSLFSPPLKKRARHYSYDEYSTHIAFPEQPAYPTLNHANGAERPTVKLATATVTTQPASSYLTIQPAGSLLQGNSQSFPSFQSTKQPGGLLQGSGQSLNSFQSTNQSAGGLLQVSSQLLGGYQSTNPSGSLLQGSSQALSGFQSINQPAITLQATNQRGGLLQGGGQSFGSLQSTNQSATSLQATNQHAEPAVLGKEQGGSWEKLQSMATAASIKKDLQIITTTGELHPITGHPHSITGHTAVTSSDVGMPPKKKFTKLQETFKTESQSLPQSVIVAGAAVGLSAPTGAGSGLGLPVATTTASSESSLSDQNDNAIWTCGKRMVDHIIDQLISTGNTTGNTTSASPTTATPKPSSKEIEAVRRIVSAEVKEREKSQAKLSGSTQMVQLVSEVVQKPQNMVEKVIEEAYNMGLAGRVKKEPGITSVTAVSAPASAAALPVSVVTQKSSPPSSTVQKSPPSTVQKSPPSTVQKSPPLSTTQKSPPASVTTTLHGSVLSPFTPTPVIAQGSPVTTTMQHTAPITGSILSSLSFRPGKVEPGLKPTLDSPSRQLEAIPEHVSPGSGAAKLSPLSALSEHEPPPAMHLAASNKVRDLAAAVRDPSANPLFAAKDPSTNPLFSTKDKLAVSVSQHSPPGQNSVAPPWYSTLGKPENKERSPQPLASSASEQPSSSSPSEQEHPEAMETESDHFVDNAAHSEDHLDYAHDDDDANQPLRKSSRRNRGQRYQKLIREGIIQPSKERMAAHRQEQIQIHLQEPDHALDMYPEEGMEEGKGGDDKPHHLKRSISESDSNSLSEEKRYCTGDFDLEAKIQNLTACSIEVMRRRHPRKRSDSESKSKCSGPSTTSSSSSQAAPCSSPPHGIKEERKTSETMLTTSSAKPATASKTTAGPNGTKATSKTAATVTTVSESLTGSQKRKMRKSSIRKLSSDDAGKMHSIADMLPKVRDATVTPHSTSQPLSTSQPPAAATQPSESTIAESSTVTVSIIQPSTNQPTTVPTPQPDQASVSSSGDATSDCDANVKSEPVISMDTSSTDEASAIATASSGDREVKNSVLTVGNSSEMCNVVEFSSKTSLVSTTGSSSCDTVVSSGSEALNPSTVTSSTDSESSTLRNLKNLKQSENTVKNVITESSASVCGGVSSSNSVTCNSANSAVSSSGVASGKVSTVRSVDSSKVQVPVSTKPSMVTPTQQANTQPTMFDQLTMLIKREMSRENDKETASAKPKPILGQRSRFDALDSSKVKVESVKVETESSEIGSDDSKRPAMLPDAGKAAVVTQIFHDYVTPSTEVLSKQTTLDSDTEKQSINFKFQLKQAEHISDPRKSAKVSLSKKSISLTQPTTVGPVSANTESTKARIFITVTTAGYEISDYAAASPLVSSVVIPSDSVAVTNVTKATPNTTMSATVTVNSALSIAAACTVAPAKTVMASSLTEKEEEEGDGLEGIVMDEGLLDEGVLRTIPGSPMAAVQS